jgi:hypothetical protein
MFQQSNWAQGAMNVFEEYRRLRDPYGPEYDQLFSKLVYTEPAESWDEFRRWSKELEGWGFRGQRNASWSLQTSLERELRLEHWYRNNGGHYYLDREANGRELLLRFQEQAPRYTHDLPAANDVASWLGLMQHYGAPTRLLDWTDSPYVALYFAIEEPDDVAAIWAIDLGWVEERGRELITPNGLPAMPRAGDARVEYLNNLLGQSTMPLIFRIDPIKGNSRIFAQSGFFLWKLFEQTPFFDQILTSMIRHPEIPCMPVVRKLEVSRGLRTEFLERLGSMGIHHSSLFPSERRDIQGLELLCRSLRRGLQEKVRAEKDAANDQLRASVLAMETRG